MEFARQIRDHFDTLYAEGAEQGRVMCIALHPYWVGQPHRIRAFRAALEYILSHPGVWVTTAGAIADWFNEQPSAADRGAPRGAGGGEWLSIAPSIPPANEQRRSGMDQPTIPFAPCRGSALHLAGRRAHCADRYADAGLLGARSAEGRQSRSAHRFATGKILPRLADLEPARIWCACRHLSRAGRAGPVRPDAQRGARCRRGDPLSGADRRTDAAQCLLHGARHVRHAPHHQPNDRGGGAGLHRRKPRRRGDSDRRRPLGWCGQDFTKSARTPALLAEAGFTYTTDWASDDRPFLLGPYHRHKLLALPPQPEWNDLECMWLRRVTPPVWADCIAEAFGYLHAEGGAAFNLTLHPWITGQAHRIRWLRDALTRVLGLPGIWRPPPTRWPLRRGPSSDRRRRGQAGSACVDFAAPANAMRFPSRSRTMNVRAPQGSVRSV